MLLDMHKKTPLALGILKEVFEKKRNYAIMITGKLQNRKSTTAIKLAYELDPNFDMDKQMACIETKDFIERLNIDNLKRGGVILLDEFGVGMNHRQWFSFLNKAVNFIMMTHGFRGLILIVTVPYSDFVDIDSKKLFDMQIDMVRKSDKEKWAIGRAQELQYNQKLKKMYYKMPRGWYGDGVVKRIDMIRFGFPPKDIMEKYFAIANEKKKALAWDLKAQSDRIQKEQVSKDFTVEKFVEIITATPEKFIRKYKGSPHISTDAICNEFKVGKMRAGLIKDMTTQKLVETRPELLRKDVAFE